MQAYCVQIREECLAKCHQKEDIFQDAIVKYFESMAYVQKLRISTAVAFDFLRDEKVPKGGRIIRDCVMQKNVTPAWTVFEENRTFDNNTVHFKMCAEEMIKPEQPSALMFLVEKIGQCPLQWISPEHRAIFYHTCLRRQNINTFKRKATSSMRKLQKIAFAIKAESETKGSIVAGGGSAKIVGGVLAGIGIVLSPLTGGASLTLKLLGTGIAMAGSMATFFSPTILNDHQQEMKELADDAETLATLLLLYTQSSSAVFDFNRNENVMRLGQKIEDEIAENHLQASVSSGLTSLTFASYIVKFGVGRMVALVNEMQIIKHLAARRTAAKT